MLTATPKNEATRWERPGAWRGRGGRMLALSLMVMALSTAGCLSTGTEGAAARPVPSGTSVEAPPLAALRGSAPYRLAPLDSVNILIYGETDLSGLFRLDAQGRVSMPLCGEIALGGLTIPAAQTVVERAFIDGQYLRQPQVLIRVAEMAPREVVITGQVRQPGSYPVPMEGGLTLLELVSKAGGFTDTARGSAVTVTRTHEGKRQTFTFDLESQIRGKAARKDFMLEYSDIIFVPERAF